MGLDVLNIVLVQYGTVFIKENKINQKCFLGKNSEKAFIVHDLLFQNVQYRIE